MCLPKPPNNGMKQNGVSEGSSLEPLKKKEKIGAKKQSGASRDASPESR